jgi:hypothetical protein
LNQSPFIGVDATTPRQQEENNDVSGQEPMIFKNIEDLRGVYISG